MSDILNFCPECRAEYREGFSVCANCEVPLVRRLDSEMGDVLVSLARETSFEFAAGLLDRLEQRGIPYVVQAGTALELLDRGVADIARPQPWEARIWVAQSASGLARDVLAQLTDEWERTRGNQNTNRYLHSTDRGSAV